MNKKLTFYGVLFIIIILIMKANHRPTEVFLLLGQSNMLGLGKIETLDNNLLNLPANVDFYIKDQKMTFKEKTFRPKYFGPEITFSKLISTHFPRRANIVIVKFGVGGRSIRCWDQNWRNSAATCGKGDRYNELMSYIRQFMNNQKFKFSGIVWMQGETDAQREELARTYGENLQSLILKFRKDLNTPNLPFIFGITERFNAPLQNHPFLEQVQNGQNIVSKKMRCVKSTLTADLSSHDGHIDSKGLLELGNRFAKNWIEHFANNPKCN